MALSGSAVLLALIWPGATLGAGGAPLPAPDDPPVGHSLTTRTTTTQAPVVPSSKTSSVTPSPDAPATAEPRRTTLRPAPSPTSAPTVRTTLPVTAASEKAPVTVEPAAVATRRAASPKPPRAPKPARRRTQPPIAHAPPHDADRLGLPLAILARTDAAPHDTALLIAAGLLLCACGAGSLTVGITVGRIARST